jgi:Cytochrome c
MKVLRFVLYLLLALLFLAGAAFAYLTVRKPDAAPAPNITVDPTPDRIARGRYLSILADCEGCHSQSDGTRFGFPRVEGGHFAGNEFTKQMGMPGLVVAPNLTPDQDSGIGSWTDGEKIRAIREGIDKDGNVLFPMMPYVHFREMSDDDVYAVIAYLNSLPPVHRVHPKTELEFPVGLMIKSVPKPVRSPVPHPDRSDRVRYGKYLATLGGCLSCHGENLAAGTVFVFPPYRVFAANISPDRETGVGKWTEKDFLDKFASYRDYLANGSPKVSADSFTTMPWLGFAQLEEEDLKAIYAYLHSVPAVKKSIETHPKKGA